MNPFPFSYKPRLTRGATKGLRDPFELSVASPTPVGWILGSQLAANRANDVVQKQENGGLP